MLEENPYAIPESLSGLAQSGYPAERFYVDGNLIMSGTPVALPAICVITGETEDVVLITQTITSVPKWIYITLLTGVMIPLILYLLLRKRCKTNFYLSRKIRNRKRWMSFVGLVSLVGGIILMIAGFDSEMPGILASLGVISVVCALSLLILGQPPLKAVRHENGIKFWLKGFKQPFFDQLRVMYANDEWLPIAFLPVAD